MGCVPSTTRSRRSSTVTPAPPQDASAIVKSPTASPAKAQRIGKRARRLTLHAETDVIIDIGRSTSPVPAGATGASSVADSVHGRGSPTPRLTPRDAAPAAAAGAPPPSSPPSAAAATGTATIAAVDVPAPTSEAAVPADDGAQWHDTVAAAAARGIADVIGLLDRHVASEPACVAWCCDAITGLCSGNEGNRDVTARAGGLHLVVRGMAAWPAHDAVQSKANWALAALASSGDAVSVLVGHGALPALVAGLRGCPDNYQVLVAATRALTNLTSPVTSPGTGDVTDGADSGGHSPIVASAVALGVVGLLEDAMAEHGADGQFKYRGELLLQRLRAPPPTERAAAPTAAAVTGGATADSLPAGAVVA